MKTFCKPKQCNVECVAFNRPAVHEAFDNGKLKRPEFQALLIGTGRITAEEIYQERREHRCNKITPAIDAVADAFTAQIAARQVEFPPLRQFKRIDGMRMKERDLCQESAKQQVFEYILRHALDPLFRAKLLPCQYGSIPGRGQVAGARAIERILRRKCRGPVASAQCDGKKAYPNSRVELVVGIVRHYCHKNKALVWLTEAVTANYPGGVLIIGGYFSTWAFNLIMAFVLRYLLSMEKVRRGHRLRMVLGAACYADDFAIFGALSNLERALKKATRWAAATLGLTIKPAWKVQHFPTIEQERENRAAKRRAPAIDMMGFVVRRLYTTIRGGIFVRIRRQLLRGWRDLQSRGFVPWWRAFKIASYFGWIKNSDSTRAQEKYHVPAIVAASKWSVGNHSRQMNKKAGKAA